MTSPWPTNWSFSHKRYLYVAALLPVRGGPLSRRMPAGAWKTFDENGHRFTSNSTRKLPASEIQETWSPSSSTTTWGIRPTNTGRSAIFLVAPWGFGPLLLILSVHSDDSIFPGENSCELRHRAHEFPLGGTWFSNFYNQPVLSGI